MCYEIIKEAGLKIGFASVKFRTRKLLGACTFYGSWLVHYLRDQLWLLYIVDGFQGIQVLQNVMSW